MQNAIELKNISKFFGDVIANKNVNLDVKKGEILSILGENGSGKTTLMNMIAGIYYPDEGEILIDGLPVTIRSPKDAFAHRIGMIHQHFKLVDVFSAADNIILGEEFQGFDIKEEKSKLCEKFAKENSEFENYKPEDHPGILSYLSAPKFHSEKEIKRAVSVLPLVKISKRLQFNWLSRNRAQTIQKIAYKYGFNIDLKKKIYDMSVSEKQTVEIIKVLYRNADILILDEPTAVLTPQEIKKLFDVLRRMKEDGKSIIIITHKLNEVMEISDRVAVMRKGEHIATVNTVETCEQELTEMMVGKKIELNINRTAPQNSEDRLVVEHISVSNHDGVKILDDVSFEARSGEILGIAGIAGSGQRELLEAIAGLQKLNGGDIWYYDPSKNNEKVDLRSKTPMQIRNLGVRLSFVPEDRLGMGLVGNMDLIDNMMLRSYKNIKKLDDEDTVTQNNSDIIDVAKDEQIDNTECNVKAEQSEEVKNNSNAFVAFMKKLGKAVANVAVKAWSAVFLDRKSPKTLAETIVKDLEVVTPSTRTPVRRLSGGNVQKVLVGREIAAAPTVLMAAYPVRGLDINSSYTIYNLLNAQKEKGVAVIYVGEDLDVLIDLCDRIMVICGGKITGIVDGRAAQKEQIGLMMMGRLSQSEGNDSVKPINGDEQGEVEREDI